MRDGGVLVAYCLLFGHITCRGERIRRHPIFFRWWDLFQVCRFFFGRNISADGVVMVPYKWRRKAFPLDLCISYPSTETPGEHADDVPGNHLFCFAT